MAREVIVNGKIFKIWNDFITFGTGTFAEDENGTVKRISYSRYIRNDLTIRKAIATAFNLPTFRK